jgi:hypothetical protein
MQESLVPEDDGVDHPFDIDDEIDVKDHGRTEDEPEKPKKKRKKTSKNP